jgi:hypothetical protein
VRPQLPSTASDAEVAAAVDADSRNFAERVANAVLARSRVQCVFWMWRRHGVPKLFCRISAQARDRASGVKGKVVGELFAGMNTAFLLRARDPAYLLCALRRSTTRLMTTWPSVTQSGRWRRGARWQLRPTLKACCVLFSHLTPPAIATSAFGRFCNTAARQAQSRSPAVALAHCRTPLAV